MDIREPDRNENIGWWGGGGRLSGKPPSPLRGTEVAINIVEIKVMVQEPGVHEESSMHSDQM